MVGWIARVLIFPEDRRTDGTGEVRVSRCAALPFLPLLLPAMLPGLPAMLPELPFSVCDASGQPVAVAGHAVVEDTLVAVFAAPARSRVVADRVFSLIAALSRRTCVKQGEAMERGCKEIIGKPSTFILCRVMLVSFSCSAVRAKEMRQIPFTSSIIEHNFNNCKSC